MQHPDRVTGQQTDSCPKLGVLQSLEGILQQLQQDFRAFDCKNTTTEGGQHRRIPAKAGGGVNYRTRAAPKELHQGVPDGRSSVKDGTDPLPRPISGHSKFSAVGPLFKGN